MAKIAEVQEVTVSLLIPYERNAKKHGREQIEKLKSSIDAFGFLTPCLIDRDYNLIAGHGRVMAAKELGMKTVPCVFVEGLTETQRRAYILADNRLGELGEWDMDIVAEELQWLQDNGLDIDITGFTLDDQIIDNKEIDELEVDADLGSMQEQKLRTRFGQLWQLGNHRLLVGDSTNIDDVLKLTDGSAIDLLETDPPYNVDVSNAAGDKIANDNMADDKFYDFLLSTFSNAEKVMRPGAAFYIWHADSNGRIFRNACEDAGLSIRQNLIWVKNHFTLGRQDYQWRHEPCLYGWKEGAAHYFSEKRNISTIIKSQQEIDSMSREDLIEYIRTLYDRSTIAEEDRPQMDDLHPTMKPVPLIMKQIKNSTKEGDAVLDLFGGSGTTLVACEKMNRVCYMMEFEPKYADAIVNRWETLTGREAVLING